MLDVTNVLKRMDGNSDATFERKGNHTDLIHTVPICKLNTLSLHNKTYRESKLIMGLMGADEILPAAMLKRTRD